VDKEIDIKQHFPLKVWWNRNLCVSLQNKSKKKDMSELIKKRTKDEIIAALKATLARKKEWEKQAQEDFKRIRQERLNLSV